MAATSTRATSALAAAQIPFAVHSYQARDTQTRRRDRVSFGGEAAEVMAQQHGVEPGRVFKTLVLAIGPGFAVAVIPVAATLSLKAAASALGASKADMAETAAAQRATGYVIGGISPVGLRRAVPVVIDDSALAWPTMFCSAGRRGLEIEVAPADLVRVTGATVAPVTRSSS